MQTLRQDQQFIGIVTSFFDNHVPPRPAKIDVADRQPVPISSVPGGFDVTNIVVAADGLSMTYDLRAGLEGASDLSFDVDASLVSGDDVSVVVPIDTITVTPAVAGPVASGTTTFPPATDV